MLAPNIQDDICLSMSDLLNICDLLTVSVRSLTGELHASREPQGGEGRTGLRVSHGQHQEPPSLQLRPWLPCLEAAMSCWRQPGRPLSELRQSAKPRKLLTR